MYAQIIVDISNSEVDRIFDYLPVNGVEVGCRVLVPFGNRTVEGFCIGFTDTTDVPESKLKSVTEVLDDYPVITAELLGLMHRMKQTYRLRYVDLLRLFIPAQMRKGKVKPLRVGYAVLAARTEDEILAAVGARAHAQIELVEYIRAEGSCRVADLNKKFSAAALRALVKKGVVEIVKERLLRKPYSEVGGSGEKGHVLTPAQRRAYDTVTAEPRTYLLHGVTGSGKTEVYMSIILNCLREGKSAIMLVPEISLTPQVLRQFRARFGDRVALLHSGLSSGERFDEWTRLREGAASIAIGARSAIFAPLSNLGAIIIDEEHDSSYISETNPRYFTHEVASLRAEANRCPLVLGSATPSMDSYHAARTGKYTLIEMPDRVNKRALPEISIVDMTREVRRGNPSIFSLELQTRLATCLQNGEQAILFLNRRGYASYQQCRACGYVVKCDDCDVSMVYHYEEQRLKCHYCGAKKEVLDVCPQCGSSAIKQGAIGTERVQHELKKLFPTARILRMDNDTTQTKDAHAEILGAFARHEADILVGTQMVAKGHDFGACTLVGILDADLGLYLSDYRAVERTYQLITQVAGRAGRAELEGHVVLQTYSPRHYVFRFAVAGDYKGFYDKEINTRETAAFPPFTTVVRIIVSGEDDSLAVDTLHRIFDEIQTLKAREEQTFVYCKAMRSPLKRLQNKHRVQIILRLACAYNAPVVSEICGIVEANRNRDLVMFTEINPQNLR